MSLLTLTEDQIRQLAENGGRVSLVDARGLVLATTAPLQFSAEAAAEAATNSVVSTPLYRGGEERRIAEILAELEKRDAV